jgi:electron transport complex protein RnfC
MSLRSFFGILPIKLPYSDSNAPPESVAMPDRLTLLYPETTPSCVALSVGDEVKTGQNLVPLGGAPLVSPATGPVEEIGGFKGSDGQTYTSVSIKPNSRETIDPSLATIHDFSKANPAELRAAINRAGFSALNAISPDPETWPKVDVLIISALDQDPHGLANQQAFRDHIDQMAEAVELLSKAAETSQCVLAVPGNLAGMAGKIPSGSHKVVLVPPVYPNGYKEILARKYGAGILLQRKDGGVAGNTLVVSAEDAVAILTCLRSGRPLTEKTITFINGNGTPKNYQIRIGTPIRALLEATGVTPQAKGKVIVNGIMGGYTCFSDEQPIGSDTMSVSVQSPSDVTFFQDTACTNCGKCNTVCPVDLEVNLLGRFSEYNVFDKCRTFGAENCIECGLCAYVCPARRPLVHLITHAKQVIKAQGPEDEDVDKGIPCETCENSCMPLRLFEPAPKEESAGENDSH